MQHDSNGFAQFPKRSSYDYDWDGIGLTINTPCGDVYIQGEEGSNLHDTLENSTQEEMEMILSEYEHICE